MSVDVNKIKEFWKNDAKRRKKLGINKGGKDYYSIKDDGEYRVRVLEMGTFMSGDHWGVLEGSEGKSGGSVNCPRVFDDSPCPICEMVEAMANSDDKQERKQAEDMAVQVKYPMLVLDMDAGDMTPKIWKAAKTPYGKIQEFVTNPRWGDILSLKKGRTFTVTRFEKANGFKDFGAVPDPEPEPINLSADKIKSLEELLKPPSVKEIEYCIKFGTWPEKKAKVEDSEDDEDSPKPSKPPKKYGKGLPKTKTEDEDEPEESEELDEEEDDAPPPPKKKAGRKPAPEPEETEDDDEEVEDDEEEEAPPPPKNKKAKKAPVEEEDDEEETEDEDDDEEEAPAKPSVKQSIQDRLKAIKEKRGK